MMSCRNVSLSEGHDEDWSQILNSDLMNPSPARRLGREEHREGLADDGLASHKGVPLRFMRR